MLRIIKRNILLKFLILIAIMWLTTTNLFSQGFKGIIPLQSTCEDVKRVLRVSECKYPKSDYVLPEMEVGINFAVEKPSKSTRRCWRVTPRTVISVSVRLRKPIPLSKFEYPLEYLVGPLEDDGTFYYTNKEKGINVTVSGNEIYFIDYGPLEADYKSLTYPCKSPDAGDDFDQPTLAINRYWNLPLKKEKQKFKEIIHGLRQLIVAYPQTQIYIVYFYKSKSDIKSGKTQAIRAKRYLETNGFKNNTIKVFNGGKEDKSEIVIYVYDTLNY